MSHLPFLESFEWHISICLGLPFCFLVKSIFGAAAGGPLEVEAASAEVEAAFACFPAQVEAASATIQEWSQQHP
jgi:hypothetical protein